MSSCDLFREEHVEKIIPRNAYELGHKIILVSNVFPYTETNKLKYLHISRQEKIVQIFPESIASQ